MAEVTLTSKVFDQNLEVPSLQQMIRIRLGKQDLGQSQLLQAGYCNGSCQEYVQKDKIESHVVSRF